MPEPKSNNVSKQSTSSASVEAQRQQMEYLMKHPDISIEIAKPKRKEISPPPELVNNVIGSSSGAGSGEFHLFKIAKRKEYERQKLFDEDEKKLKDAEEFNKVKQLHESRDQAKTNKNRLRRQKRAAKQKSQPQTSQGKEDDKGGRELDEHEDKRLKLEGLKQKETKETVVIVEDSAF